MNHILDRIIEAVLYEGYILYPYRPSAKKNRQRFTCGRVYPQAYSLSENGLERCAIQTECLITNPDRGVLEVSVRFLQPLIRELKLLGEPMPKTKWEEDSTPALQAVPEARINGRLYQSWQEAIERRVQLPPVQLDPVNVDRALQFHFGSSRTLEAIEDGNGQVVAVYARQQEAIAGTVEVCIRTLELGLAKVTVRVVNATPMQSSAMGTQEAVLLRTMASTHTVLQVRGAAFSSLLEPRPEHKKAAEACLNLGTWPVLVGDRQQGQRDTMLSSPIILYDYPQIAPESTGTYFDGTEIDEMLALRVQTLTDEEKQELRETSEEARRLLERTEALSQDDLLRLHGVRRDSADRSHRLLELKLNGFSLRIGDRVRLKPQGRADIFDLALNGQVAQIESIEQDLEDRVHVAVVLENDPGKDLGLLRQPGHRFFFGLDELEPLSGEAFPKARRQELTHE